MSVVWAVIERTRKALDCHFSLVTPPGGGWIASFHGCASDGKRDRGVADTHGRSRRHDEPWWAIIEAAEQAMEKAEAP